MSYLKRTPIKKVSAKQKHELYLRRRLRRILLAEGPHDEAGNPLCWHCEKPPDFKDGKGRLHLSHTVSLRQGGKTEKNNLELLCRICHNKMHGIIEC